MGKLFVQAPEITVWYIGTSVEKALAGLPWDDYDDAREAVDDLVVADDDFCHIYECTFKMKSIQHCHSVGDITEHPPEDAEIIEIG